MKTALRLASVKYVLIESLIACLMRSRPGDWCSFISTCVRKTLGYCPDMVETANESKHGPTAVHSDSGDLHTSKANVNFLAEKKHASKQCSEWIFELRIDFRLLNCLRLTLKWHSQSPIPLKISLS